MIYWVQREWTWSIAITSTPGILLHPTVRLSFSLTAREKECWPGAARGQTVADNAQILGLSPETV